MAQRPRRLDWEWKTQTPDGHGTRRIRYVHALRPTLCYCFVPPQNYVFGSCPPVTLYVAKSQDRRDVDNKLAPWCKLVASDMFAKVVWCLAHMNRYTRGPGFNPWPRVENFVFGAFSLVPTHPWWVDQNSTWLEVRQRARTGHCFHTVCRSHWRWYVTLTVDTHFTGLYADFVKPS